MNRRTLITAAGAAAAGVVLGSGVTWIAKSAQASADRDAFGREKADLEGKVTRLSRGIFASGGGVNVKMMPDPKTGQPTVALPEVFSFDRNHAICRVDTNPQAFKMPTYSMGEVTIEAHRFYMAMNATSIERYTVSTRADGKREAVLTGGLDCATEVGQGTTTIGSRAAPEHVSYKIVALDGGPGGGKAGDTFAFTVFFDPQESPVNYAIFGPEATFTGQMVEGEVTIIDPARD